MELVVGLVIGVAAGGVAGLAIAHVLHSGVAVRLAAEAATAEARFGDAQAAVTRVGAQLQETAQDLRRAEAERAALVAELSHLRTAGEERAVELAGDRERLVGAFAELSTQALAQNAEQFLSLADARLKEAQEAARGELGQRQQAIASLLVPLQESLARYETGLRQLELERRGAYVGLTEQVRQLATSHEQLQKETGKLVSALRSPQTRGRWGEIQLRRVVEMAGMVAHCDFDEQVTTTGDSGRLRPDLVVHLPGGAQVVVDAKVPLDAFLRAVEADDDETRRAQLAAHARQVRTHVDQLAKREYWAQFDRSPEFVVAFIPGDPLLAAAFDQDPTLIEHAFRSGVFLTTPTTLIALLRTVAHGWQREDLAENARVLQRLGSELYDRLRVLGTHLAKLQRSLSTSVEAFNDAVGSLESRVLVTARRFPELGVVGAGVKPLDELRPVVATARLPQAQELRSVDEGTAPDLGSALGRPPGLRQLRPIGEMTEIDQRSGPEVEGETGEGGR